MQWMVLGNKKPVPNAYQAKKRRALTIAKPRNTSEGIIAFSTWPFPYDIYCTVTGGKANRR